ncbi:hypothetical protein LIER_27678 [Lithospermum erythrorhizon]|uniref:Uncharacterized protein n=1 Tax=Lithospermum erythrorhizon TaxID=34254 RepID=A0AAV3REE8_LITER
MACLDMYNQNNEHKGHGGQLPMSPRISFSNDFVESSSSNTTSANSHHHNLHQQMMRMAYRDAPVSSDFEFSVPNYSMMSADELFSQGKLLPYKESCNNIKQMQKGTTTLRDELLAEDNDDEDGNFPLKPPKTSPRWRGILGLKKSNLGSKKVDKSERSSSSAFEDTHTNKNSQDPNSRDFEFRF